MYTGVCHAIIFEGPEYYPATILSFDAETGRASLAYWEAEGAEQVMVVKHDVDLHKLPQEAYPCCFGGGGPKNAVYLPDADPMHRVVASSYGPGAAPGTLRLSMPDLAGGVQVLDVPELVTPPAQTVWMLDPTWQSPPAIVSAVAALLST